MSSQEAKEQTESLLKDMGITDVAIKAIIALTLSMDTNSKALNNIVENTDQMNQFFKSKDGIVKLIKDVVREEQRFLILKLSLAIMGLTTFISSIFMFINNNKIEALMEFLKENMSK